MYEKDQSGSCISRVGKSRPFSGKPHHLNGPTIASEHFGETEGHHTKMLSKMFSPTSTDGNALTVSRYGTNLIMDQASATAYKQVMGAASKMYQSISEVNGNYSSKRKYYLRRKTGMASSKTCRSGEGTNRER